MNPNPFFHASRSLRTPLLRHWLAAAALLLATSASAATPGGKAAIESRYQQDRAACASEAAQERSSCLREAGAVRAEALRGRVKGGESEEVRMRNALQRCNGLPADRQSLCERMVRGEGSASGSVEGGGVIRELTIMVPAPAAATGSPATGQPLPPAGSPSPMR